MANGPSKRASMREGPLAALFRKTEEGEGTETPQEPPAAPPQQEAAPPPEPARREVPHPSLAVPPVDAPRVPSPQERLRHAFSSDVPDNLMERPRAHAPRDDVYARADAPSAYDAPRQIGHPIIRVVGVGGAGVNAVNRMVEAQVEGVEFLAINTDLQSLQQSNADLTVHIGSGITRGLGAGANPDLGRSAAMEEYDKVKSLLKGSDMVFIAAGAGGGTGTGAGPIVARIAREVGALTVGIVTKPFG